MSGVAWPADAPGEVPGGAEGSGVVSAGGSRDELAASLVDLEEQEIATEELPEDVVERYRRLCPMAENSTGLYRYVVKRQS